MQSMTTGFSRRRAGTRVLSVFLALLMAFSVLPAALVGAFAAAAPLRIATLSDIHYFAREDMGNLDDGFYAAMNTNNIPQIDGILDSTFAALAQSAS